MTCVLTDAERARFREHMERGCTPSDRWAHIDNTNHGHDVTHWHRVVSWRAWFDGDTYLGNRGGALTTAENTESAPPEDATELQKDPNDG
jgi:hypothetical protein